VRDHRHESLASSFRSSKQWHPFNSIAFSRRNSGNDESATGTAVMRNRKRIRVIISDYSADTARWSVIHMVSLPVSHGAGNSFDKMLSSTD